MRTASPELLAHLAEEETTVTSCWKITESDGNTLGFTALDVDLVIDGLTYQAANGFDQTSMAMKSDLSVDNQEVTGFFFADLEEADILNGALDGAKVEQFLVNYNSLEDGGVTILTGVVGKVTIKDNNYEIELFSNAQRLRQDTGITVGPLCRANLGDAACGVDLAPLKVSGAVDTVTSESVFNSVDALEAGMFELGVLTWEDTDGAGEGTGGANTGTSAEIKAVNGNEITLLFDQFYDMMAGDTFSCVPGCDKTADTCKTRFNNIANFRGFPYVPGASEVLASANAK